MTTAQNNTAELWHVDDATYHDDAPDSVSRSELEEFRTDPEVYHARYIAKSLPPKRSDRMDFGSATHAWFLVPELFDSFVVEIPDDVLGKGGRKNTAAWRDFAAENSDKLLLKASEMEAVRGMQQAALSDPKIHWLLTAEGYTEQAIRWTDPDTGLACRCKPDRVMRAIVDLKTHSGNPRDLKKLASHIESMGYHRQAAFYQDGVYALTGELRPFVFVFVCTKPPYPCVAVELPFAWIEAGREQNQRAMESLAVAFDYDDWRHATHGEIVQLARPGWAKYADEWELE